MWVMGVEKHFCPLGDVGGETGATFSARKTAAGLLEKGSPPLSATSNLT